VSGWLIIAVGIVYACIAAEQALKGNWGTAVVFAGYSFSNAGLWMTVK
jgi:hypothetical protein